MVNEKNNKKKKTSHQTACVNRKWWLSHSCRGHGVSEGTQRPYFCRRLTLEVLIITHLSSTSTAGGDGVSVWTRCARGNSVFSWYSLQLSCGFRGMWALAAPAVCCRPTDLHWAWCQKNSRGIMNPGCSTVWSNCVPPGFVYLHLYNFMPVLVDYR